MADALIGEAVGADLGLLGYGCAEAAGVIVVHVEEFARFKKPKETIK